MVENFPQEIKYLQTLHGNILLNKIKVYVQNYYKFVIFCVNMINQVNHRAIKHTLFSLSRILIPDWLKSRSIDYVQIIGLFWRCVPKRPSPLGKITSKCGKIRIKIT